MAKPKRKKKDKFDFYTPVSIEFSLTGTKHRVFPDLLEEELFAIGRVTVGFAYLEHLILADTVRMANSRRASLPDDAFSTFKRRLRLWKKLVRKYRRGKSRERLLELAHRTSSCQAARNRITHGLWNWEYGTPDKTTSYAGKRWSPEHFDFHKLLKVGDRIAEINFELSYPKGKSQAWASLAKRGFGASRGFAYTMTGKKLPPSLERQFQSSVASQTRPREKHPIPEKLFSKL